MQRLPVDVVAEFRGARPASEFVRDGRTIAVPPKLKFEFVWPDGEPYLIEISAGQVDQRTTLDWAKLERGAKVRIAGEAVIQERGADADSYFALRAAEAIEASARPARAA